MNFKNDRAEKNKVENDDTIYWLFEICIFSIMLFYHFVDYSIPPPEDYPWFYPMLNASFCFCYFICVFLYSNYDLLKMVYKKEGDYEKIGDYAFKISKSIELMKENGLKFSNIADKEIKIMYNIVEDVIVRTHDILTDRKVSTICEIEALRQIADRYKENYKSEHIERLKEGNCTVENGIAFIELLADMDKIINHCVNIAVQSLNIVGKE